jgi:hypothetical protein
MSLRLVTLTFAISLIPVAANARVTIEMANVTCDQYLAMSPSQSKNFSSWMSGWFSYKLGNAFVDFVAHQQNIAAVKAWCKLHPKEKVMSGLEHSTGAR